MAVGQLLSAVRLIVFQLYSAIVLRDTVTREHEDAVRSFEIFELIHLVAIVLPIAVLAVPRQGNTDEENELKVD